MRLHERIDPVTVLEAITWKVYLYIFVSFFVSNLKTEYYMSP